MARNKVLELGLTCIFCGKPADSREHVFGEWLQEFVETDLDGNHRQGITRFDATGGAVIVDDTEVLIHGGGSMTRRLPVVCGQVCNGGWMSRLERAIKPWFGPMVQGAATELADERRRQLALWAEKTVMVFETTDQGSVTSTQEEREFIREHQKPNPLTLKSGLDTATRRSGSLEFGTSMGAAASTTTL